ANIERGCLEGGLPPCQHRARLPRGWSTTVPTSSVVASRVVYHRANIERGRLEGGVPPSRHRARLTRRWCTTAPTSNALRRLAAAHIGASRRLGCRRRERA